MATQTTNFTASGLPVAGANIHASDVNTTMNALIADYNLQIGNNKIADASVTYGKLSIAGGILNADINASAAIAGSKLGITWTTWTPTLTPSGSMSLTSQVNTYCKYAIIGKMFFFNLKCTYTIGGTPSTSIAVTGFPNANAGLYGSAAVTIYDNGAVDISGNGNFNNSGTTLTIYKYDGSNFTAGTLRALYISGFYEIA